LRKNLTRSKSEGALGLVTDIPSAKLAMVFLAMAFFKEFQLLPFMLSGSA